MRRRRSPSRRRPRPRSRSRPGLSSAIGGGGRPLAFEQKLIDEEVQRRMEVKIEAVFQHKFQSEEFQKKLQENIDVARKALDGKLQEALEEEEERQNVLKKKADEAERKKGEDIAALATQMREMQKKRLDEIHAKNLAEEEEKRTKKRGKRLVEQTCPVAQTIEEAVEVMEDAKKNTVAGECVDYLEKFRRMIAGEPVDEPEEAKPAPPQAAQGWNKGKGAGGNPAPLAMPWNNAQAQWQGANAWGGEEWWGEDNSWWGGDWWQNTGKVGKKHKGPRPQAGLQQIALPQVAPAPQGAAGVNVLQALGPKAVGKSTPPLAPLPKSGPEAPSPNASLAAKAVPKGAAPVEVAS